MKARTLLCGGQEVAITRADYVDLSRQGVLIPGSAYFEDGDDESPFPVDVPAVGAVPAAPESAPTPPAPAEGNDPDPAPDEKE